MKYFYIIAIFKNTNLNDDIPINMETFLLYNGFFFPPQITVYACVFRV